MTKAFILLLIIFFTSFVNAGYPITEENLTNITFTTKDSWFLNRNNILVVNTYSYENLTDIEDIFINNSKLKGSVYKLIDEERKDVGLYYITLYFEATEEKTIELELIALKKGIQTSFSKSIHLKNRNVFQAFLDSIENKISRYKSNLERDTIDTSVNTVLIAVGLTILFTIMMIIAISYSNKKKNNK